ncbi:MULTISPECIES: MATE family efflux transporter [Bradyrhizobium]|jgi:putative MATE family efflux protein|uniref:Multidrug export protein MepA n=2 Tax=Bradyrhizobium TaxID=374 RepID=A0ABY0PWM8_9BRAD|nr:MULTISPECIES: MATE family efflux transporter [Bradyrhizobium]SDJ07609.1 putative efflux protein, MATE family [Bradyrhizobium ottawaense]SEC95714.1 putative efflux protein, MATE family [Bradyrhizobium lablabi]SHL02787.1 putative efflux protein, MATE family [Bradyrhizobium lablabi]
MTDRTNAYTGDSIPRTFARTALPIMLLTSVNGLLTVVDAMFLGAFVGPDALTAVTMGFPLSMLMVALATMIASGMASVLGRLLGAARLDEARSIFAGAHGLSFCVSAVAMALFAVFGWPLALSVATGSTELAVMAHSFLSVTIFTSPLLFLLSVQSDALRTEGRVGIMAFAGLMVTLANIGFNYLLIAPLKFGVAGSAWGTALAQAIALALVVLYRQSGRARLRLTSVDLASWRTGWREMLALGAPRSLAFIGIAAGAAATILSLRLNGGAHADESIAAYGVLSRMMTFAYFPLLGMSLALQAMVSNNAGAGLWLRSNATLKLALAWSLAYAGVAEGLLILFRKGLGGLFVTDVVVIAEVTRILPVFVAGYFSFGPMMMIANYFQSIGDVRRSALLSLARTYLFAIPLIFLLPLAIGEQGIWLALPLADLALVGVTLAVLRARSSKAEWGLFHGA